MKQTLIIAFALTGSWASAKEIAELKYGYNFDALSDGVYDMTNLADVPGGAIVGGSGRGAQESTKTFGGSGHSIDPANDTLSLTGVNISFEQGFTIGANFCTELRSSPFFSFTIDDNDYVFRTSFNSNTVTMAEPNGAGGRDLTGVFDWTWYTVLISGQMVDGEAALSYSVYRVNEEDLKGTVSYNTTGYSADTVLSDVYLGNGAGSGSFADNTMMDNFVIYQGKLDDEQRLDLANSLSNNTIAQQIPEPASATLSLFALACLMRRRRRA